MIHMGISEIASQGIYAASLPQKAERTPDNKLDKDAFLQILAAQLRYQDPLGGGDNTQFIAQMAQFSTLEQIQNLNNTMTDMLSFQYLQFGSQLVGKNVTLNDGGQTVQGLVDKVRLTGGDIELVVNGTPYTMDQIEDIGVPGSEPEIPTGPSGSGEAEEA